MNAKQNVAIALTEAQETRVLNVQEFDKTKWQETCDAIFELGLKARENSIKATKARRIADEKAAKLDKFNTFVAQGMNVADALMYAGLATKETIAQAKPTSEATEVVAA